MKDPPPRLGGGGSGEDGTDWATGTGSNTDAQRTGSLGSLATRTNSINGTWERTAEVGSARASSYGTLSGSTTRNASFSAQSSSIPNDAVATRNRNLSLGDLVSGGTDREDSDVVRSASVSNSLQAPRPQGSRRNSSLSGPGGRTIRQPSITLRSGSIWNGLETLGEVSARRNLSLGGLNSSTLTDIPAFARSASIPNSLGVPDGPAARRNHSLGGLSSTSGPSTTRHASLSSSLQVPRPGMTRRNSSVGGLSGSTGRGSSSRSGSIPISVEGFGVTTRRNLSLGALSHSTGESSSSAYSRRSSTVSRRNPSVATSSRRNSTASGSNFTSSQDIFASRRQDVLFSAVDPFQWSGPSRNSSVTASSDGGNHDPLSGRKRAATCNAMDTPKSSGPRRNSSHVAPTSPRLHDCLAFGPTNIISAPPVSLQSTGPTDTVGRGPSSSTSWTRSLGSLIQRVSSMWRRAPNPPAPEAKAHVNSDSSCTTSTTANHEKLEPSENAACQGSVTIPDPQMSTHYPRPSVATTLRHDSSHNGTASRPNDSQPEQSAVRPGPKAGASYWMWAPTQSSSDLSSVSVVTPDVKIDDIDSEKKSALSNWSLGGTPPLSDTSSDLKKVVYENDAVITPFSWSGSSGKAPKTPGSVSESSPSLKKGGYETDGKATPSNWSISSGKLSKGDSSFSESSPSLKKRDYESKGKLTPSNWSISSGKQSRVSTSRGSDTVSTDRGSGKSSSLSADQRSLSSSTTPSELPPEFLDIIEQCDDEHVVPPEPVDQARVLTPRELNIQRYGFFAGVLTLNILCIILAYVQHKGKAIFTVILFIKCRDIMSVIITIIGMIAGAVKRFLYPLPPVTPQFILTLIPAYSESQEQILKAIHALRNNGVEPHHQVMLVILDGKPVDIKSSMTRVCKEIERPHDTFKAKRISLGIVAGFIGDVPVLVIQKRKNSGKKDTLILTNDLFNYPRDNMPIYTKRLRREIWNDILPELTAEFPIPFTKFDMIFNTDADSKIHQGALLRLANALVHEPRAIASCGLVLVEFEEGLEWSPWNMYQQFQYCYGQYVRRRAEHIWGKVTCLPGCITMIKVRPECGPAVKKYAAPITGRNAVAHQVQYLGTDRRQTYCFLSQSLDLKTLFIPNAVSETVAPQSLDHYLSQRRRWGSNAYFNNFFYCFGENMALITRLVATLELVRLTLVYWRFSNTIQFLTSLVRHLSDGTFKPLSLAPLISIGQLPFFWFVFCVFKEKPLRVHMHKLALGFMINKTVAPFMSMAVFTKVAMNIGSQVWGLTGTAPTAAPQPVVEPIPECVTEEPTIPYDKAKAKAMAIEEDNPRSSGSVSEDYYPQTYGSIGGDTLYDMRINNTFGSVGGETMIDGMSRSRFASVDEGAFPNSMAAGPPRRGSLAGFEPKRSGSIVGYEPKRSGSLVRSGSIVGYETRRSRSLAGFERRGSLSQRGAPKLFNEAEWSTKAAQKLQQFSVEEEEEEEEEEGGLVKPGKPFDNPMWSGSKAAGKQMQVIIHEEEISTPSSSSTGSSNAFDEAAWSATKAAQNQQQFEAREKERIAAAKVYDVPVWTGTKAAGKQAQVIIHEKEIATPNSSSTDSSGTPNVFDRAAWSATGAAMVAENRSRPSPTESPRMATPRKHLDNGSWPVIVTAVVHEQGSPFSLEHGKDFRQRKKRRWWSRGPKVDDDYDCDV